MKSARHTADKWEERSVEQVSHVSQCIGVSRQVEYKKHFRISKTLLCQPKGELTRNATASAYGNIDSSHFNQWSRTEEDKINHRRTSEKPTNETCFDHLIGSCKRPSLKNVLTVEYLLDFESRQSRNHHEWFQYWTLCGSSRLFKVDQNISTIIILIINVAWSYVSLLQRLKFYWFWRLVTWALLLVQIFIPTLPKTLTLMLVKRETVNVSWLSLSYTNIHLKMLLWFRILKV